MEKNKILKYASIFAIALIVITLLSMCSSEERLVKKFIGRINAREYNSASAYIYPGDHPKLRMFCNVMDKNPNLLIKILENNVCKIDGKEAVITKLQFTNTTAYFHNYMNDMDKLISENAVLVDTFYIREHEKGDVLSFDWANIKGEDLKTATIQEGYKKINIRSAPTKSSRILGVMDSTQNIVIDNYSDIKWVKCFYINNKCHVVSGYINKKLLKSTSSNFFNLSWFDKMGLLLCVIVLALVGVVPLALMSIVRGAFGNPLYAILALVALILLPFYVAYEIIEHIVFELFLYNLPY